MGFSLRIDDCGNTKRLCRGMRSRLCLYNGQRAGDHWSPLREISEQVGKTSVFWGDLHIIFVYRFHPDFVGATKGRPLLRLCKNAGMRHVRSPASVAAVPDGGLGGHRRRISSARSILYHCRRCPHVRAKPRTPRRGARSLHKPQASKSARDTVFRCLGRFRHV